MNVVIGARRRRGWISPFLIIPLALGVVDVSARAQASDSGRVYRFQMRRGDTSAYYRSLHDARQQLELRLDSLRRELEGMGLDAPDRRALSRELRVIISSLADLTQLDPQMRTRVPSMIGQNLRSMSEALAHTEVFAGPRLRSGATLQPGWIGLNIEAPHTRMVVRNDSAYIRYFGYPEIVSVEPNSPAERVGMTRGDQIIAYDGADLRNREINLTRLLQPSRRITVTIRRDGEERQFPIVVTKPPPQVITRRQLTLPGGALDSMPDGVMLRAAPRLRGGGSTVLFDPMDPEKAPVAGAKLTEIRNDELGHIFGVSSGVLVTEVFSDPARSSGLRGGDVIVTADGQDLASVAQLRRIVARHNGDRAVDLEIVRQKRTRQLTLRW
jgi:C-terminal processing protease CtpA/Prc